MTNPDPSLASLSSHSFSIKLISRLTPSHCQLAAISTQMNIVPSVPMRHSSGAGSESADTMMNSHGQPSHRKELFSCRTFPSQERWAILYSSGVGSGTEVSRRSCCLYYRPYRMQCLGIFFLSHHKFNGIELSLDSVLNWSICVFISLT